MNFYDALNAHLVWKQRLRNYVDGVTSEYLEPEKVGCDDGCDLGKWIHAHYPAMMALPEFIRARELHADFHRCAAEVVELVNQGDHDGAQAALAGEYATLSALVIKAITKLNKVVGDGDDDSAAA